MIDKFQFVELNTERVALLRDPLSFWHFPVSIFYGIVPSAVIISFRKR